MLALIIFTKITFVVGLLENLTPCEQEQLAKLTEWAQTADADQVAARLKELCHMSKAWDLTAKLNIPQLSDPDFDPVADPVQLPLQPYQKSYLQSQQQCKDSNACMSSLTKPTLRVKVAGRRDNQSAQFRMLIKRQTAQIRVIRKEYRAMSDQERVAFQKAVLLLKFKTVNSSYNAFDLHASLHSAAYSPQAHFGCSFVPFHRIYLLMLEKQLQEVSGNNALAVPYWDSTLDSSLPSPCDSIMFSNDLLGMLFCGWASRKSSIFRAIKWFHQCRAIRKLPNPEGMLSRNCQGNRTIRPNDIRVMQGISNYSQCCYCVSSLLELVHGTMHSLVNGIMNNLNRASFDPAFWMHHSFVDKIYEDIQVNWRVKPSDPNFTAPACLPQGIDSLTEPMLPFGYRNRTTGQIIGLRNQDGLQARFTKEDYGYAPSPNCTLKTCTGRFLYCDNNKICKSRIRNGGRCNQQIAELFTANGINACMEGYKCLRNATSGQFSCELTSLAPQTAYYYYYA